VVRRLVVAFNEQGLAMKGRRILLLGLSYKRNTGDARESPSLAIARLLLDLGAEVVGADPHVSDHLDPRIERVEATPAEAAEADAVIVLVAHDAFDLTELAEHAPYVFDTQRCIEGPNVEHL